MEFELKDGMCYLFDAETENLLTSFSTTGMTATIGTTETETEKEKEMIRIIDVDVEYEKKTFVDDTKRDGNGNYLVTKKEVPVATIVTFENGNCQVAVCDENDEFNLEIGISICVTRELMERLYGVCGYTNAYNKVMRNGLKVYKKACKKKEVLKKKKVEQEAIEKNRKIKEQKRREKRAAKKKEREIEILTEAIKRANADSNK